MLHWSLVRGRLGTALLVLMITAGGGFSSGCCYDTIEWCFYIEDLSTCSKKSDGIGSDCPCNRMSIITVHNYEGPAGPQTRTHYWAPPGLCNVRIWCWTGPRSAGWVSLEEVVRCCPPSNKIVCVVESGRINIPRHPCSASTPNRFVTKIPAECTCWGTCPVV